MALYQLRFSPPIKPHECLKWPSQWVLGLIKTCEMTHGRCVLNSSLWNCHIKHMASVGGEQLWAHLALVNHKYWPPHAQTFLRRFWPFFQAAIRWTISHSFITLDVLSIWAQASFFPHFTRQALSEQPSLLALTSVLTEWCISCSAALPETGCAYSWVIVVIMVIQWGQKVWD